MGDKKNCGCGQNPCVTYGSEQDERVCFICNMTPEESDSPMMSTLGGDACKDCAEQHGYEHPRDMIYLDAETSMKMFMVKEYPHTITKEQHDEIIKLLDENDPNADIFYVRYGDTMRIMSPHGPLKASYLPTYSAESDQFPSMHYGDHDSDVQEKYQEMLDEWDYDEDPPSIEEWMKEEEEYDRRLQEYDGTGEYERAMQERMEDDYEAETFEAPKTMTKTQAQKKFLSILKPYWLKRLKGEQKSLDDWLKRSDKTQDNKEFYQTDWDWWNNHVKIVQSGAYGPASPEGDTVLREALPDSYYYFIEQLAGGLPEELDEKYDFDNGFDITNLYDNETHSCILDGEPSEDDYSAADRRKLNALEKRWESDKITFDEYVETWEAITDKYSTQKFHRNEASRVKCRYCGPAIKAINNMNNWTWEYLDEYDEFWEACKSDKIPTRELKSLTNVILGKAKPKPKPKAKAKSRLSIAKGSKPGTLVKIGRKAPTISATKRKIGTRMRGNDGKMWEVKKAGKSQRWMAGAEETQHSETDAYSFAYSQGHNDGHKDAGYKPQLTRTSDEKYFRKILNQRAEGINKKSGLSWIDTEETDETWDDEMEVIEKHLSSQGYKKCGSGQFFSNRTYAYVLYRFRKYLLDLPDKIKGYRGVVEDREYLNYMSNSQFVFSPWENKAKNKVALVWQFYDSEGFLVSEPYYKYFSLTTPPSWYDRSFELHFGEDYRYDSCPMCDYKNPMKSLSDARKLAAHIYSHGPVLDGSPFGDFSVEIRNWWDGEPATAYWGNPAGFQTEILESQLPYLYGLEIAEHWSPTKAQQARYTKKEKAIKAGLRAAGLKPKS